ncbi:MAG: CHAD domain-containing protein [Bryobacterales bacterium]|nr:CHAD domain-containing protein [Bryobacterales bacterium]
MILRDYAGKKIAELENRVRTEAAKTLANGSADAIHDLRVSIRRLTQALRALESVIGKQQAKQTRRKLRKWMNAAAEIRNRDIALELLEDAGITDDSPVVERVKAGRDAAHEQLALLLARSQS